MTGVSGRGDGGPLARTCEPGDATSSRRVKPGVRADNATPDNFISGRTDTVTPTGNIGRWLCVRCEVTWRGDQLCWCCLSGAYSVCSREVVRPGAPQYQDAA